MLTVLFSIAFAQQEACQPQAPAALTTALDAVDPLLGQDPKAAGKALDAAAEVARCLSAPIDKDALARLAWSRAELAALAQEMDKTWSWAQLAIDLGSTEPPERLPPFHPLRTLLEEAPEPPPVSGPDDVVLAAPRKGTVFADGKALSAPQLRLETPHLVQVFSKGELFLGIWQTGAAFSPSLIQPREAVVTRPTSDAHDSVPPANWKPAKSGTVEAYEAWIAKHPDGPWLQEAKDAIDEMAWEKARTTDSDLAYRQYVYDFPEGLHRRQAQLFVEHNAYLEVMKRPSREKWEGFLEKFPEGTYANEARLQIDNIDWRAAQRSNTPEAYRAFIEKHPEGPNMKRAVAREEERFFEKSAQVLSEFQLKAYLERWPKGRFVREAHALLGEVAIDDVVVIVEGSLEEADREAVRAKLLELLEKRRLPVVEAEGPNTGRLHVTTRSGPDGAYLRVKADIALEYKDLQRPLVELKIDSPVLASAQVGEMLGGMITESLPPFETWHKPPPEEEDAAGKKKKPK
ncbi:MAG: hypothetical protein KC656_14820 [Myxococcales bacterium]|nr:hypothetical protein [Myxococcales bacterium]